MVRLGLRLAALVLLLAASGGLPAAAQPATPGPAGTASPATVVHLVAGTLPAALRPSGTPTVAWIREEWEPGTRRFFAAAENLAGLNVAYLLAGSFELHVAGPVLLGRAAGGLTGPLAAAPEGEPISLAPGDLVAFPNHAERHARNIGPDRARLLSIQFLDVGLGGAVPARGDDEIRRELLGTIVPEAWAAVPPGDLELDLRRTLVPAGAALPSYRVTPATPELLAVEAGLMEIGFDYDGDGIPEQWLAVDAFIPINEMLEGTEERFIRASTSPPLRISDEPPDPDRPPDPLVFLTLSFSASGGASGTPAAGPTDPASGQASTACTAANAWADLLRDRLRTINQESGTVLRADSTELVGLPTADIRQAAAALFELYETLEASGPPAIVAALNDNLAYVARLLATNLFGVVTAIEAGDPIATEDYADLAVEYAASYRAEIALTAEVLATECPASGDAG